CFGGESGETRLATRLTWVRDVKRPTRGGDTREQECAPVARGGYAGVFGKRSPGGGRGRISQPVTERVEHAVGYVGGARPVGWKRAREVEARLALRVTHEHVGETSAFGARQPGHDERVGGI